MNIVWTIFMFNPIEALLLFYMCNAYANKRYKYLDIIKKYYIRIFVLSTINFCVQYLPNIFLDIDILYLINSIMCNVFISSITLYLIYNKVSRIAFWKCFLINFYYFISLIVVVSIFKLGFATFNKDLWFEIYGNALIKSVQFLVFIVGDKMIKEILKKFYDKNAKDKASFTPENWYEPEMSDEMKKEIEED